MSKLLSIDGRPGPGIAILTVVDFGRFFESQLWSKCTARKAGVCDSSGMSFLPGSEVYRPVGNSQNRSMRILATQIEKP
jgi:hypothetical protein